MSLHIRESGSPLAMLWYCLLICPAHSLHIAAQLSEEVKELLDKIFKVNERERISIEGIKEDPWYREPLQPKYAAAEQRIAEQQKRVEEMCRRRALNPVRPSLSL